MLKYVSVLIPFFRQCWFVYLLGVSLLIAVDALQLFVPRLIGQIIDSLLQKQAILQYLVDLLILAFLSAVLRYIYRECIMGSTRRLEYYLRSTIFDHALYISLPFFDKEGPGKIMALTTNDVSAVRYAVGLGVILLVDAVIMGLVSFAVMVKSMNLALAGWAVAPIFPLLTVATIMGRVMHKRYRQVQEKFSELTEFVQEAFSGARVIKGFAAETLWIRRFSAVSKDNVNVNLSMANFQAVYMPITHILPFFSYALVLYFGGVMVVEGKMTIGDLTAFFAYLGLILWPIMGVGYLINTLQRGAASLVRIGQFLETPVYESRETDKTSLALYGNIEICNLTYQYADTGVPAIGNINLKIPQGAKVGIVGRPGSGKSTLLKLLLRLYDPPVGTICIAGREVHEYSFLQLRNNIGYVPQDGILFSRTIGENIAFDKTYSRDKIVEAANIAAIGEAIDAKPEGYALAVGEQGKRLSGGQQQRVAIARAIIKNPDILLLDDVFSALDYHTQSQVIKNLQAYFAGHTAIIVSQRIAPLKDADFIVVLDQGSIVEQGTHEQLVRNKGLYFKLYEQQLAGGDV